jgi:chemotaxis protein CheX
MFSNSLFDSHVETVKQAVLESFGNMGVAPQFTGNSNTGAPTDGLVSVISLVGDIAWSLMVGVPRETAAMLAAAFTGFEVPDDGADMADVVGELVNVLAGFVVNNLEGIGIVANLSLPTVVRGRNIEMMAPEGLPSTRMDFSSTPGNFWVQVAVSKHSHLHRA